MLHHLIREPRCSPEVLIAVHLSVFVSVKEKPNYSHYAARNTFRIVHSLQPIITRTGWSSNAKVLHTIKPVHLF